MAFWEYVLFQRAGEKRRRSMNFSTIFAAMLQRVIKNNPFNEALMTAIAITPIMSACQHC